MHLEGSCHCGAVRFSCDSPHPVPYQRCYCSICRKTAGSGGYAINIMGRAETLEIEGAENLSTYQAKMEDGVSQAERRFCRLCGSHLWLFDSRWPELIHPQASAIDTELPKPPQKTHIMLGSKPGWIVPDIGPNDKTFDGYPDESIADWHHRTGTAEESEN
ncbi:GFA family protein [Rhizobium sp. L1K21]|uniref:GFA family protein n=1 Tax=Rhizobium sp. L1K21 TaxID=2954933 RepID=UPI00209255B3|nr:GFA family protein [Rhizobium sp. L1K21]MCO6185875.1 GFA family protein [Rhizobium sp. L1K21]